MADNKKVVKATLEEKNAAQDEITILNEHLRRLDDSSSVCIQGSNKGNGIWKSEIPTEDFEPVRDFFRKRWNAKIKLLKKVVEA